MQKFIRRGGRASLRLLAAASIAAAASGALGGVAAAHTSTYRPLTCDHPAGAPAPCGMETKDPYPSAGKTETKKPHEQPCKCGEQKPYPHPGKSESPSEQPSEQPTEPTKPTESATAKPVAPAGAPQTGGGGTAGPDAMFVVPLAAAGILAPIGIALTRRRRVAHE